MRLCQHGFHQPLRLPVSRICEKVRRAAVIGGGSFGEAHLKTYASMPGIEISGVCTLDEARGETLCRQFGGRHYESAEAVAADPEVDLVSIVTPEDCHYEAFQLLAASGKAIYVEKPLATSLAEARRMVELSENITAMSGHCLRFEQRLATTFAKLEGAAIRHLSFRNRRTRHEKAVYGRVHPAFAMLCHEIELSNAFAGAAFRRVSALETRYSEGAVDGMMILIEYENGVTSCVEGGWHLPGQMAAPENDFVSIVSDRGVDEMHLPHTGHYRFTEGGLEIPNTYYGHSVYGVEYGPLRAALDYFLRCVQTQCAPEISTIRDGYHAVELVEAALLSARESRWVSREETRQFFKTP